MIGICVANIHVGAIDPDHSSVVQLSGYIGVGSASQFPLANGLLLDLEDGPGLSVILPASCKKQRPFFIHAVLYTRCRLLSFSIPAPESLCPGMWKIRSFAEVANRRIVVGVAIVRGGS